MSRPPCENCNCARRNLEHNKAVLQREIAEPPITEQVARGFIPFEADDD